MTGVAEPTVPAVTEKVADVWPCATVTEAGTFAPAGDELRLTVAPPLAAAVVSETEQVEPVDGLMFIGLQVRPFKAGVWTMVTVLPLAEVAMADPIVSADIPAVTTTDEEVSVVVDESVKVTAPTTPLGITELFRPHTRQVIVPGLLLQERVLPESAGPAAKVAEEKSDVE